MKPTRLSTELTMIPEPSGSVLLMRVAMGVQHINVPPGTGTHPKRIEETQFRISAFELKALITVAQQPK